MTDTTDALEKAIEIAGGVKALATQLGISHQAVLQWKACPPLRVLDVERLTGVPRHELRPDVYPPHEVRRPFPIEGAIR